MKKIENTRKTTAGGSEFLFFQNEDSKVSKWHFDSHFDLLIYLISKYKLVQEILTKPGMVKRCTLLTLKQKQDLDYLVYRASSLEARASQRNPVTKNKYLNK